MSELTEEYFEFLSEIKLELMEYCHHPECTAIHECPRDHEICKETLDLDTAIAWQLVREIKTMSHNACVMMAGEERVLKEAEDLQVQLGFAYNTVRAHSRRYSQLKDILSRFYYRNICYIHRFAEVIWEGRNNERN